MAILLKTASIWVSSIQIMQVWVQNKGKSVWKSRYDGDVSPAIHSLASIAFDVVKSYVRIFPSWKYYNEDEGKSQLQVFVHELCVSNVIHGKYLALSHTFYLHTSYNTSNVPIFLYREGLIRLQRIYNFLLFHVVILSFLDVLQ